MFYNGIIFLKSCRRKTCFLVIKNTPIVLNSLETLNQGSPTPGPDSYGPWAVRDWATWQEVSGVQRSKLQLLLPIAHFTPDPPLSRPVCGKSVF